MTGEKTIRKPRGVARLLPGKCIACGARCQSKCARDAIEMNDKGEPVINLERCTGCRRCLKVCPVEALDIYYTPEELKILAELAARAPAATAATATAVKEAVVETPEMARLKEYKGVWVFVEQSEGQPAQVAWELLGVGGELAEERGVELCAVVIGDKVEHLCHEAFAYGATKAYLMDNPAFHYYRTEPYYKAICHLVEKFKPEIILVGATGLVRDLAGAVATSLKTGLTADCTGLAIDDRGFLLQTRPAFGGNIMATIICPDERPQMATVRHKVMKKAPYDSNLKGEVIKKDKAFRVLDLAEKESLKLGNLSQADYVVLGKAVASGGAPVPQSTMRSCFANLSAKLIRVKDSKVIAYLDAAGNSVHLDMITGGREALVSAAANLAPKLIEAINKQEALKESTRGGK